MNAETPAEFTMQPNTSLEENSVVNFSCFANAGNPEGVVKIWKQRINSRYLLGESSLTDAMRRNCSTFVHFTLPYTLVRLDREAIFWCSSQNNLTVVPARSRNISTTDILCEFSLVILRVLFLKRQSLFNWNNDVMTFG